MGSTAQASDALGKALIAQRDLTVPKRFEARSRILQAGAALGQDSGRTAELANLALKRNRSVDENRRFTQLGSELEALRQQGINDEGNFGRQNVAELIGDGLQSAGVFQAFQAAGNATLTTESGQAGVNKDFAQGASNLLKATGALNDWATGIGKNAIVSALGSAVGSAIATLGLGRIIGGLGTIISRRGGGPRPSPRGGPRPSPLDLAGGGPPRPPGGGRGAVRAVIDTLRGGYQAMTQMLSWGNITNGIRSVASGIKNASRFIWDGVRTSFGFVQNIARVAGGFGRTLLGGLTSAIGGAFGSLRSLIPTITNGVKGFFSGTLSNAFTSALNFVSRGGLRVVGGILAKGLGTIFRGAFAVLGGTGVISAIFGGVMEIFTGNLNSALNDTANSSWFGNGISGFADKLFGKVTGIIGAIIHGFFTGFTDIGDLIIGAWNLTMGNLFSGLRINLGATLTNFFDRAWAGMMVMFKETELKIAKFFHLDSWAESLQRDINVANKSIDALRADGSKSLTDIGSDNQKLIAEQKDAAKKTKENVSAATKNVQASAGVITDTQDLTAKLLSQAVGIRSAQSQVTTDKTPVNGQQSLDRAGAGKPAPATVTPVPTPPTPSPTVVSVPTPTPSPPTLVSVPTPVIAMPGQTTRSGITDPAVNIPTDAAVAPPTPAGALPPAPGIPGTTPTDALIAQVAAMNNLLQQILTAEQAQAAGIDNLSRAAGRPTFSDNETMFRLFNRA
ncbi:hypothetical protein [Acinetobacter sp.]|uniref:hypothetical protein n=1 Tax=Acinetobacter sp. TaxID=472 RepID=UPI00388EB0EB